MSIPAWILDIFAAVMLLVAVLSAGQLAVARAWTRRGAADADIAISHLLMGSAMAGMLVAGLSTLPNAAWDVIFAVMTAWFAWCLWRESRGRGAAAAVRGHHAPHLVQSAAMLYIFAAIAGPATDGSGMSLSGMGGMPGMAGGSAGGMPALHAPTLALVFTLLLVGFTVRDLDRRADVEAYFHVVGRRLVPAGPAPAAAAAGPASGAGAVVTVAPPQPARADAAEPAPRAGRTGPAAERLLLAPTVVKGRRVATGVTIAFMLITMI